MDSCRPAVVTAVRSQKLGRHVDSWSSKSLETSSDEIYLTGIQAGPRVLALECVVPCFSPVITPSTHSHLFSHQIKYQPSRVQLYEMATVFVKRHTYLRLSNSYKFMPCWLAPGRQESERRVGVSMIRKNN